MIVHEKTPNISQFHVVEFEYDSENMSWKSTNNILNKLKSFDTVSCQGKVYASAVYKGDKGAISTHILKSGFSPLKGGYNLIEVMAHFAGHKLIHKKTGKIIETQEDYDNALEINRDAEKINMTVKRHVPWFKDKWEAIDHAKEYAKYNPEYMYPVYVTSQGPFSDAVMLREVFGIKTLEIGFHDEVHYEDVWCEVYNACFMKDFIQVPDHGECELMRLVKGVFKFTIIHPEPEGGIFKYLDDNYIL